MPGNKTAQGQQVCCKNRQLAVLPRTCVQINKGQQMICGFIYLSNCILCTITRLSDNSCSTEVPE